MFIRQVLKTIRHYKMFEPGERVVVAVSGGPDSVCLLHALLKLNTSLCLKMCVAHLDHRLRRNSGQDLAFVKELAQSLEIPFYSKALDWKRERRSGSLENCLRELRYRFLFETCGTFKAQKIVLGHTKDDQAETVLMRILRGSGLHGLSSILPKRAAGPFKIVRPLIEVTRRELLSYLKKNKLPYRLDESNRDEKFMRNKIRHKLLPLLESQYNVHIREVLSSLALLAGADYDCLQRRAARFFKKNVRCKDDVWSVDSKALGKLDIALQRLVLRNILEGIQGDLLRLTFKHWQEAESLLNARPVNSQVHLPGDITISKTSGYLNIFKR